MKNMVVKWISWEDFLKNFLGELSNNSSRRKTHNYFGELSSNSPRRVVQLNFIEKLVLRFQEQKPFVLKTVFSHAWLRHA